MKRLKVTAIFILISFATTIPTTAPTPAALSPTQEFALDFLYQELNQYSDLFLNQWTTNDSVQLIVESAELAIQNASPQTQPIMQQRIKGLFSLIGIPIEFTPQNLIMKVQSDQTERTHTSQPQAHKKTEKHAFFKIKRHRPIATTNTVTKKIVIPRKIKGARRTLRRLKKKATDQEKAKQERELAEIRRKTALKEKMHEEDEEQDHEEEINMNAFKPIER